ncbi:MAG: toll/interleukin-1 receptor domain-containing protein [Gemmatimonadota bacterium]
MKVFISWSGPRSRAVAEALNDWLRRVIQAVRPFYSPDIDKGAKWSSEIDQALEGTSFGIVCLTKDNLSSEWIHYEAGALSKTPDALIWTLLLDVQPSEVRQPLGKYQHTVADKNDMWKLIQTINNRLSDPLGDSVLFDSFEQNWPRLDAVLRDVQAIPELQESSAGTHDKIGEWDARAMFSEILELLRAQARTLAPEPQESFTAVRSTNYEPLEGLDATSITISWDAPPEVVRPFFTRLALDLPETRRMTKAEPRLPGSPRALFVTFREPVNTRRIRHAIAAAASDVGVNEPVWLVTQRV